MSYNTVYGTAGAVLVDNTVFVEQTGPAATGNRIIANRSDRQVIMTVRNEGKPTEHVLVRTELVIPVCPVCTAQHRGECF